MTAKSANPPPGAKSIDQILSEARSHIQRLTPSLLHRELVSPDPVWGPTHLVDIRPASQRSVEGAFTLSLPGELESSNLESNSSNSNPAHKIHIIERNVLEWRFDPQSEARIQEIVDAFGYATRIVVVCSEGYTSSLAASELQRLGLSNATDLDGGYWAWKGFLEREDNESLSNG
jgi:rhodanese-related sulfurtransferase